MNHKAEIRRVLLAHYTEAEIDAARLDAARAAPQQLDLTKDRDWAHLYRLTKARIRARLEWL